MKLERWIYSTNYMGKDFSDYFILYIKSRDSDLVIQSNYDTIREEFIDLPGVVEVTFSHWACGWIDELLIHEYAKDTLEKAEKIFEQLEKYPVLNDIDLSQREYDLALSVYEDILRDLNKNPNEYINIGIRKDMTKDEIIEKILESGMIY